MKNRFVRRGGMSANADKQEENPILRWKNKTQHLVVLILGFWQIDESAKLWESKWKESQILVN
ncbi:MAG: hypothetical protein V2J07_06315 [Anaerolineae bacterium]|jgi:hypothetical protein|nr:hypothetical protein [Anaerolineae bacterium]